MTLRIAAAIAAVIFLILGIIQGNMDAAEWWAPHYFGSDLIFWLQVFPAILIVLVLVGDRNLDLIASFGFLSQTLYIVVTTFKNNDADEFFLSLSSIMNNGFVNTLLALLIIYMVLHDGRTARLAGTFATVIAAYFAAASLFYTFYLLGESHTGYQRVGAIAEVMFFLAAIFVANAFKMERSNN